MCQWLLYNWLVKVKDTTVIVIVSYHEKINILATVKGLILIFQSL